MSAAPALTADASVCHLATPLPLSLGGVLADARIAYASWGDERLPTVVALGGISAGRHVAARADGSPGWWQALVGPGQALDTDRFRVIGMDWLGGRGASTGPASEDAAFPRITTADQAEALARLLDHLDVTRVHAIAGGSYGGMVALAFAAQHGHRADRIIALGAAHRPHPFATALRALQRDVVRLGLEVGRAADALALARALAVTTYRTAEEFADRFDGPPVLSRGAYRFPVEGYLQHQGRTFAGTFPAASFLALSESIDLHDVEPSRVRVPATLIAFEGDTLVPPSQVRALARQLGAPCRVHTVRSRFGHDGFLKEAGALTPIIGAALEAEVAQ